MIGPADLAVMKPTSFLINTSRGPLVQEEALVDALRNNKIAGAGLDVYDVEPLPLDHPLRTLKNVTLSHTMDTSMTRITRSVKALIVLYTCIEQRT